MLSAVREGITKVTGLCVAGGAIINMSALPAGATVLEFDNDGNVTVTQSEIETPAQSSTLASRSQQDTRQLVREIAARYSGTAGVRAAGLDAITFIDVFDALIQRESAYDPHAVSPKGAQGLGQLMPGTAADMGVDDPFDERSNLIGSAKYFTSLLAEFGTVELALAGYNAGPERVRQHGGIPPFEETEAYISWISEKAGISLKRPDRTQTSPVAIPINKEQPLEGDVSVWEF
jgi:soluble lytic murein transglycosylase-like protein